MKTKHLAISHTITPKGWFKKPTTVTHWNYLTWLTNFQEFKLLIKQS